MPFKEYKTVIRTDVASLWSFHSTAEALSKLTPPGRKLQMVSDHLEVREGAVHEFKVKVGPLWTTWRAKLSEVQPPNGFRDTALTSPFKSWSHKHEFIQQEEGVLLKDTIEYTLPFGLLGDVVNWLFVSRDIDKLFDFRHAQTKNSLETS